MALTQVTNADVYYALEADRPITTAGIAVGSIVIFTDSLNEESFDGTAWFKRGSTGGAAHTVTAIQSANNFKNWSLQETLEPIAAFNVDKTDKLGLQVVVDDNALDQFEIHVQYSDKGDWVNLSLDNTDFTTPNYPVLQSNITNIAAVAVGTSYLDLDVSAYYRVLIKAASSSASLSKLNIFTGDPAPLPRRVKNEIAAAYVKVSDFPTSTISGGTIAFDDALGEVTFNCPTAGVDRAFINLSNDTSPITTVVGNYYAVSMDVVSTTATVDAIHLDVQTVTADEGTLVTSTNAIGGTRAMVVFRASSAAATIVRMGLATTGTNVLAASMVCKNFMIQDLGAGVESLGEYVPPGHTQLFANSKSNAYNNLTDTFIAGVTTNITANPIYSGFTVGDSFSNGFTDFSGQVDISLGQGTTSVYGVASKTLVSIGADINDYFSGSLPIQYRESVVEYNIPTDSQPIYWGVIQSGINDIIQAVAASGNPIGAMQTAFIAIVTKFKSLSIKPIAVNVSPWAGNSSWDLSDFDQMQTDHWNAWLKEYCQINDIPHVDVYDALEDKTIADNLASSATTTGTHNGVGNAAALTDSTANFVPSGLIGRVISNTTDGSTGTITANTSTVVTATLAGGTDNDWDASDAYSIPSIDYDSGDGEHPNVAGYKVIGDLILLEVFKLV